MQVGSLVECIDNSKFSQFVKLKTIYTVRDIVLSGHIFKHQAMDGIAREDGIYLVEVITPPFMGLFELPFPTKNFKELLTGQEVNIETLLEPIEIQVI